MNTDMLRPGGTSLRHRGWLRPLIATLTAFAFVLALVGGRAATATAAATESHAVAGELEATAEEAEPAPPPPPPAPNPNCPRLLANVVGLVTGLTAQAVAAWTTCRDNGPGVACTTALAAVLQLALQLWQSYQNWCALCSPQAPLCGGGGGGGNQPPPAPPEIPKPAPPNVLPPPIKPAPVPPPAPQPEQPQPEQPNVPMGT